MKQKNFFKKLLTLVLLLVASTTGAWADEISTLTFTAACGGSGTADDDAVWTVTSDAAESNFDNTKGIHYGTSKQAVSYLKLSTSDISGTITQIVVNASGASNTSAKLNVTVGGNAFGSQQSLTSSATNYTLTGSASGEIIVSLTQESAKKALYVKSITVTYSTGGGSSVTAPTFSVVSGAVTAGTTVSLIQPTADEIRYTTDGTAPTTTTGTVYSTPIAITEPVTIKAIAVEGGVESSVATATYTISVTTPTITGGTNVTITGDEGCTFYYTTAVGDNVPDNPNNNSTEYTAPFTPADGTKIKAIAYDAYGNKSDVTSVFTFKYMPLAPKNYNTNFYVKVTDVNDLENGDAILIVCETHEQALSTTQNTNNRGATGVTIDGSGIIENPDNKVQKLILVKKTEKISDDNTDVFYFYTGSAGYLYAASNSSNHLKTEEAPDNNNNARATISISSGDATILFTGTNANKWLKHNNSGTSNLFSCYPTTNTTMDIVQIYKEVLTSVDVTDANYATYVTAYDIDFAASTGVTAYKVTGTDGKIELEEVDAAPKGTPLVIAATENTYELAVATSTPAAVTGNLLKAADGTQIGNGAGNFYVLGKDTQGKVGFGPLANGVKLAIGKAYILGTDVTAKGFLPFVIGDEESETTSINSIENSELRIENYDYFNLSGQRVSKDYKGIVVVNGKKVIRK